MNRLQQIIQNFMNKSKAPVGPSYETMLIQEKIQRLPMPVPAMCYNWTPDENGHVTVWIETPSRFHELNNFWAKGRTMHDAVQSLYDGLYYELYGEIKEEA